MKNAILFMLLFGSILLSAQSTNIRKAYRDATKSEENANAFYDLVKDISQSDKAVMVAYKGAGKMLLARYEPLTKRKGKVKEGMEWIEKAMKSDSDNVEIRLIRLSIQENLPKFLKYSEDIEEDKKFIKNALPNIKDKELTEMINGYFSEFSKK